METGKSKVLQSESGSGKVNGLSLILNPKGLEPADYIDPV